VKNLYASPVRVYLFLAFLAAFGAWAGTTLPISMFPNVTQPRITVQFNPQGLTRDEFRNRFGAQIESGLKNIERGPLRVEAVKSDYWSNYINYEVTFNWNADAEEARREVSTFVDAAAASMPEEIRRTKWVWGGSSNRNSGFFLATYRSEKRSPSEVYDIINPIFKARTANLKDAKGIELWNPASQEIAITLRPDRMASLGLFPQDVNAAIRSSLQEYSGGTVKLGKTDYTIAMPKQSRSVQDIEGLLIPTQGRGLVRLSEIAHVGLKKGQSNLNKTSGIQSLIFYAQPKEGGNIKRLSEELKQSMAEVAKIIPSDITYDILIDPSIFIRESVQNVVHEVLIGATLAVIILFLFIGSLRNVITAAIEIPLSLVLSFLLMKTFGMNLNLISLGGLALSCGMNVDASVVVMENIFRKFETVKPGELSASERLERVVSAVREVWAPILASTIASLVVFIPIIFTSDLTYAILGDLARAVVFSHLFSAFVALLLVPTVRLHIMNATKGSGDSHHSPFERPIRAMEGLFERSLRWFVRRKRIIAAASLLVCAALAILATTVLPKLPREIVGKPDSTMVYIWFSNHTHTRIQQVEALGTEVERTITKKLPGRCQFLFTQIYESGGSIICGLSDKRLMKPTMQTLEKRFKKTNDTNYHVGQWNVAELPLREPEDLQLNFSGGTVEERARGVAEIKDRLRGRFPKIGFFTSGESSGQSQITLTPKLEVWRGLAQAGFSRSPGELLAALRGFTTADSSESLISNNNTLPIRVAAPDFKLSDVESLRAFPIAIQDKILPLRALFTIQTSSGLGGMTYLDGEPAMRLFGRVPLEQRAKSASILEKVHSYIESLKRDLKLPPGVAFELGEPDKEVRDAIRQLGVAAGWSVALIFITMLLQFGSIFEALLVLVAVPLALIGVALSLFLFKSTLSVNSVLGVILLNGISVANSILLVDFSKRLFAQGYSPHEAVVTAARRRLRPILITSLTTILGMMPIALGYGEGGKVLQPLGIAVSGGMWISMLLTIFMVPALHRIYLARRFKRGAQTEAKTP
jgi:HAE1 family hydrophobic/amphiphilic exporter-1